MTDGAIKSPPADATEAMGCQPVREDKGQGKGRELMAWVYVLK